MILFILLRSFSFFILSFSPWFLVLLRSFSVWALVPLWFLCGPSCFLNRSILSVVSFFILLFFSPSGTSCFGTASSTESAMQITLKWTELGQCVHWLHQQDYFFEINALFMLMAIKMNCFTHNRRNMLNTVGDGCFLVWFFTWVPHTASNPLVWCSLDPQENCRFNEINGICHH